jgi:hypothetical protein
MSQTVIAFAMALWTTACATLETSKSQFIDLVQKTGPVELTGWMSWKFEIMLFVDRVTLEKDIARKWESAQDAGTAFPRCVSGVFPAEIDMYDYQKFDKRKVAVKGTLVDYKSLPKGEDEFPVHNTTLAGQVILNQCWGTNVLLLESVKLAK